ncbi:MAG: serine/threonine-protein kinase [Myxococcota bacterium]
MAAHKEQLGKYTLLERIGVGGMAEVWLARASGPGGFAKGCVVKTVRAGVDEDRFGRMFMDEARLAALLNHPNIVQIFDFGEDGGRLYIAMEFILGRTLRAVMKKCEVKHIGIPMEHAARILSGVLEGLDHAHAQTDKDGAPLKIIHRDISPENIMVTYSGVPKVVDFGIAKATLSTDRTRDGRAKGKLTYMAPEQLMGAPLDHRVDIYACGVVLYELCCGRHPYPIPNAEALARAILHDEAPHPQELNPSLPDDLAEVIIQCMQKDPEHRFASARDMQRRLDAYLQTLTISPQATKMDQFISNLMAEEMAEDAARARKAAGAVATQPVQAMGHQPSLLADDGERDTVREATPRSLEPDAPKAIKPPSPTVPGTSEIPTDEGMRPVPPPAPVPMLSSESPLTTTDRRALERVFRTGTDGRAVPPSPPLPPPVVYESSPEAASVAAAFNTQTGPMIKGNRWQVPRRVAVAALVTTAVASGAVGGATMWILGVQEGVKRGQATVTPSPTRLSVTADSACEVRVDNTSHGSAPLRRLDITPGTHTVVLRCPHGDVTTRVSAVEGNEVAVVLPALPSSGKPARDPAATPVSTTPKPDDTRPQDNRAPNEGYISVVARRSGTLFLNGKRLGDVPNKPLVVAPGSYTVRLVERGGKDRMVKLDVARGKTATARFP